MMTDRFTDRARRVLELALREALQLGHNYIAPEHIQLAIMREGENLAARALSDLDVRSRILNAMRDEPRGCGHTPCDRCNWCDVCRRQLGGTPHEKVCFCDKDHEPRLCVRCEKKRPPVTVSIQESDA